mmetsp:Transcript_24/g.49  ORF Transcript_24/g.49 Transcript_24/m.49 type:complete len:343 (+) Transcript_24:89-1117(+)
MMTFRVHNGIHGPLRSAWPIYSSCFHRLHLLAVLSLCLSPERRRIKIFHDKAVLVFDNCINQLLSFALIEQYRVPSELTEVLIYNFEFVFGFFITWIRNCFDFAASRREFLAERRQVANAVSLGNLVEDRDAVALVRRVLSGKSDAASSIGNVDKRTRLSTSSIRCDIKAKSGLDGKTVQNGSVVAIDIQAVDEARITFSFRGIQTPDNSLMKVGDLQLVVFYVEIEQNVVQALGGVVDRSRVVGGDDLHLLFTHFDIDVTFRDCSVNSTIAVDTHGAEVNQMSVRGMFQHGYQNVVHAQDVVTYGLGLVVRGLHRVRGSTNLSKMDNVIRLIFFHELHDFG